MMQSEHLPRNMELCPQLRPGLFLAMWRWSEAPLPDHLGGGRGADFGCVEPCILLVSTTSLGTTMKHGYFRNHLHFAPGICVLGASGQGTSSPGVNALSRVRQACGWDLRDGKF